MSTEALFLFTVVALTLAAFLIFSTMRTARAEQREAELARARAEAAREEAERARQQRFEWEARLAADVEVQREAILAGGDPRGLHDGLELRPQRTGRFKRVARDVPAPFVD